MKRDRRYESGHCIDCPCAIAGAKLKDISTWAWEHINETRHRVEIKSWRWGLLIGNATLGFGPNSVHIGLRVASRAQGVTGRRPPADQSHAGVRARGGRRGSGAGGRREAPDTVPR